jgi:hypothetical protein
LAHINQAGQVTSRFSDIGTNEPINSIFKSGDTLFVAGDFNAVGKSVRGPVGIDKNSGNTVYGFPELNDGGQIRTVIPDGVGGWFIGGLFSKIGDILRTNIAHVNSIQQVTSFNPVVDGEVIDIGIHNNVMYIGGAITEINGQLRNNIGAIDLNTGSVTAFAPVVNGAVGQFEFHNGVIYLSGWFSQINGVSCNIIGAVELVSDSVLGWFPSLWATNQYIPYANLLLRGDSLFISGNFNYVDNFSRNFLAGFDLNNQTLLPWNPDPDTINTFSEFYNNFLIGYGGYLNSLDPTIKFVDLTTGSITTLLGGTHVHSIEVIGDTLFVADGLVDGGIRAYDLTNTWPPLAWTSTVYGNAALMEAQDSILLLHGLGITSVIGQRRNRVMSINLMNDSLTQLAPPVIDDNVLAIQVSGNHIYIGGYFDQCGAFYRDMIAKLDRYSGNVTSWQGPSLTGWSVTSLNISGDVLSAGGDFRYQHVASNKYNFIALDKNTGGMKPWTFTVNSPVAGFEENNGLLYLFGGFDSVGWQPHNGIAKFDPVSGTVMQVPNINVNYPGITSFSIDDHYLYIGGWYFDTINGVPRNHLAKFDTISGTITTWDPNPNGTVITYINSKGEKVIVSGNFNMIGQKKLENFAALDLNTGMPTALNPKPNKKVTSIAYNDSDLFLGGEFDSVNNISRFRIAGINKSTGAITPFNPPLSPSSYFINDLLIRDSILFIGGNFWIPSLNIARIASYNFISDTIVSVIDSLAGTVKNLMESNDTI